MSVYCGVCEYIVYACVLGMGRVLYEKGTTLS